MTKTGAEIFSQYNALQRTLDYLNIRNGAGELTTFLRGRSKCVFMGSGSSFSISKSAAAVLRRYGYYNTMALTAGDFLVNADEYIEQFNDALVVIPSRSGKTTELIRAVEIIRSKKQITLLAITAVEHSPLGMLADCSLEIPWAFDHSVCQTRTVTNLYAALLHVDALILSRDAMIDEINSVCSHGNAYMENYKERIRRISGRDWTNVAVLADGVVEGIAEEGALAFKEICQLHSNCYNLLDSRHGPAVLFDHRTLVIIFTSGGDAGLQSGLIADYGKKGCTIVTVGPGDFSVGADLAVQLPSLTHREVLGIPFIFVPQLLSLEKALHLGVDPDNPAGLTPWIKL